MLGLFLKNSVKHDIADLDFFREIRKEASMFLNVEEAGLKRYAGFDTLLEDIFFALYKKEPKLVNVDLMEEIFLVNRQFLSTMMDSVSYKEMRIYSCHDITGSALGAMVLAWNFIEQLSKDDELGKMIKEYNYSYDAYQAAERSTSEASIYEEQALDAEGNKELVQYYKSLAKSARARDVELKNRSNSLAGNVKDTLARNQFKIRKSIHTAGLVAAQTLGQVANTVNGWGLAGPAYERMPIDAKLQFIEKIATSESFKRLAEVIGRYRNLARSKKKEQRTKYQLEIHSVTTGDDLKRVLPSELVNLRHPVLKKEFFRKLQEKQLFEYDLQGKEKLGKGAIIALLDSSSSTSGSKEAFIRGTAMGLLDIANQEKRDFVAVFFAGPQTPLKVMEFRKGQGDPEKIYELGTCFLSGGTGFEDPLNKAVELISQSPYQNADIVMLTDGICEVSEPWLKSFLELKQKKIFHVYSVLMDVDETYGNTVELFSDRVEVISDVLEDIAADLFASI
jgi:uncharacterized protein with von Willebrand factor type A (vWA) domain